MRLERRIREGAERNAGVIDPDVERTLETVVRKTRRRVMVHRTLTAMIAIPAVALAVVVGPHVLEAVRSPRATPPATAPTPTAPSPNTSPLGGAVFARTIHEGLAVVRANGIAGRWMIATDTFGRVRILAPRSFRGASTSRPFELIGSKLRTDAFRGGLCSGMRAGTYGWARVDRYLMLTAIFDPCDARVWLLTSGQWTRRS